MQNKPKEEYWYNWTCAHTGIKYKTHFYTPEEREKECQRQLQCLSNAFSLANECQKMSDEFYNFLKK